MIVQVGANGNVLAYNYSLDPFWTSIPNNAAGDMVLHGNYPYSNLFEQNVCQNIIIDNSHGPNGPYNTFFRNRAESYGIFFSSTNSPAQNFLGNDIPNTNIPFSLVNYTIQGSDHFIHGNNNKGTIDPIGTEVLPDISYAYTTRPTFIPLDQWAGIGTPNVMGATDIPALTNFDLGYFFGNSCGYIIDGIEDDKLNKAIQIFPNPATDQITVRTNYPNGNLTVYNMMGLVIHSEFKTEGSYTLEMNNWVAGVYFISIELPNNTTIVEKVIKIE